MDSELFSKDNIRLLCEKYCEISKIDCDNFKVVKSELKDATGSPNGFLATHKFLDVCLEIQKDDGKISTHHTKFFSKSVPINTTQKDYVEEFVVFKKESAVYEVIIPQLQKFCPSDKWFFSPICFLATHEQLVFEDLVSQGFGLGTQEDGTLDYCHLQCALHSLAGQHAASIAFEEKTGSSIQNLFGDILAENAYPNDPHNVRYTVFHTASDVLCEFVKLIPKYGLSANIHQILDKFRKALKKIFQFSQSSAKYRNAFLHADLWANNVMFRYETEINNNINEVTKAPKECRLVDYQLARCAPPAMDVVALLTIPTTKAFRDKYFEKLLREYYASLRTHLNIQDVDVTKVLPENEFWRSIEEFRLAGLIESCLFSHLTLLPENITSKMIHDPDKFDEFLYSERAKVCLMAFNTNRIYCDRLSEMVSEIIDCYT